MPHLLPTDPQAKRRQRVQSAETGMTILKALARLGGAASLTAIAAESAESAAKVHRYLSSLASEGLVAQHPATQHYHLGPEAVRIGLAALRQCDPVRLGEPALQAWPSINNYTGLPRTTRSQRRVLLYYRHSPL